MLKVGDTVKVVGKTRSGYTLKELIQIGTFCTVTEVCDDKCYGITSIDGKHFFYYLENDLEKGELVWIPEKQK